MMKQPELLVGATFFNKAPFPLQERFIILC